MSHAASLAALLFAVLLGAMSPGPSFLMVAGVSMSRSRRQGIAAALGMGGGATMLALLAVLGIKTFFATFPQCYLALQIAGGTYLSYTGIRIWRNAGVPISAEGSTSTGSGGTFRTAFLIQISNPKTIVFYGSIFAAILPARVSVEVAALLPTLVFLVEFGWYTLVAVVLSAKSPRTLYMRAKVRLDSIAGGLILFLGLRLLAAAFR